ncbi:MAG: DUF6603 domain-containing protein [Acidimicrobiales bacterium]
MTPGKLRAAFERIADAHPGGAIALPADAASGLSIDVRARLAQFARLLTATGQLVIRQAVVVQTPTGVTVTGIADALGFAALPVTLTVGQGDAASCTLDGTATSALPIHRGLGWRALTVQLQANDGDDLPVGILNATLDSNGVALPLQVRNVHLDPDDPSASAVWSFAIPATPALDAAMLLGVDSDIDALLALLPALAGAGAADSFRWVSAGAQCALEATLTLAGTVDLLPQALSVTASRATIRLVPPTALDQQWQRHLVLEGTATVLGATEAVVVTLRPGPAGVAARVQITALTGPQRRVDALVSAFAGPSATGLTDLPAGLDGHITGSGFHSVAVEVGPGDGAVGFEGDGDFLGVPAWGRVAVTGRDVAVRLRLNGPPSTLAAIAQNDLGLTLPAGFAAHLPTVGMALREVAYDTRDGLVQVGGQLSGATWLLDLRAGLVLGDPQRFGSDVPPTYRFEAGQFYEPPAASSAGAPTPPAASLPPPSLTQLLGALLPAGGHDDALKSLGAATPKGLRTMLDGTVVYAADVGWTPGTSSTPSQLSLWLAGTVPFRSGGQVASIQLGYLSWPGGLSAWNAALTVPFLRLDLVDLVELFHLPGAAVGLARNQLTVGLERVDLSSDGVTIVGSITVNGLQAELTVKASETAGVWSASLHLSVGGYVFNLAATGGTTPRFRASLSAESGLVTLAELVEELGAGTLPATLDLAVDEVALVFEPDAGGAAFTASVEIGGHPLSAQLATLDLTRQPPERVVAGSVSFPDLAVGLGQVPLVGRLLPDPDALGLALEGLAVQYSSLALTSDEADELNTLTDRRIGAVGAPLAAGIATTGRIRIGSTSLALPAPAPPANGAAPPAAAGAAPATAPPASSGGITWLPVDKSAGPVHLTQLGVGHAEGAITVGLSGAVELGPLELTLVGLRAAIPLAALTDPTRLGDISFGLDGMGLEVTTPSVTIGGALVRRGDRLDGAALLSTSALSVRALVSLTETADGEPSVFLYGVLDRQLGGPSFLFVTGLAAGFGYQRDLDLPAVGDVASFLLVAAALGTGPKATTIDDLVIMLEAPATAAAFPPRAGAWFIAAGVKFTSFKVAETFAVLTLSFTGPGGAGARIGLVGLSTVELPPRELTRQSPTPPPPPLARVSLGLVASYDVDRGALDVRGQLVGSYVLSPKATLTGGFALLAFFKDDPTSGAKAGDFVVTVGGYHPHFRPEPWYPKVGRLALDWQVTPQMGVHGDAYFALAPHAVMAGGSLDAHWESGGLSARFTLAADFRLQWEPYAYEVGFDMGVHGRLQWGPFDISVGVHAAVELYGPPFGGAASLDLGIATMALAFGAGRPPGDPLPLDQFSGRFFPPARQICGASVSGGAVGHDDATGVWMVTPNDVEVSVASVVPATSIHAGALAFAALGAPAAGTGGRSVPGGLALPDAAALRDSVAVVPCRALAATPLAFHVERHDAAGNVDVTGHFVATVTTKAQPAALWTAAGETAPPSIAPGATGVVLRPKPPRPAPHTASIPLASLLDESLNDEPVTAGLATSTRLVPLVALDLPVPTDQRDAVRQDVWTSFGFDPATVAARPRPPHSLMLPTLAVTEAVPV